jgi:hypothetical protein
MSSKLKEGIAPMTGKQRYRPPNKTFVQAFLNPGDSMRDAITAAREQFAWIDSPQLTADLAAAHDKAKALINGNRGDAYWKAFTRALVAAPDIHDAQHRKANPHAKRARRQV